MNYLLSLSIILWRKKGKQLMKIFKKHVYEKTIEQIYLLNNFKYCLKKVKYHKFIWLLVLFKFQRKRSQSLCLKIFDQLWMNMRCTSWKRMKERLSKTKKQRSSVRRKNKNQSFIIRKSIRFLWRLKLVY